MYTVCIIKCTILPNFGVKKLHYNGQPYSDDECRIFVPMISTKEQRIHSLALVAFISATADNSSVQKITVLGTSSRITHE